GAVGVQLVEKPKALLLNRQWRDGAGGPAGNGFFGRVALVGRAAAEPFREQRLFGGREAVGLTGRGGLDVVPHLNDWYSVRSGPGLTHLIAGAHAFCVYAC